MRSWWLSLLVLSAVTLDIGLSQSPQCDIQYEIRVIEAVKSFNREEKFPYLYKLLNDVPATLLQDKNKFQTLEFEIKETVCPKSAKRDSEQCDYNPDGETMVCTIHLAEKDEDVVKCSILSKILRRKRRPGAGSVIGVVKISKSYGL
ncbi:cathelicidin-related antimicrobial peptide Na_CRAMP-like [Mixophyes fleayi]|uniref:cathelicidin-related antimicrobial peptide Na_CRAMP-like n=1 Tax=Mixophyes fleayi TaxID=3061075 RepID=UPI003F4D886D